jgi:hypothetical protein
MKRKNNARVYRGAQLDYLAFPLGGIGAGMLCLDGNGAFSHVSVCNTPVFSFHAENFLSQHRAPRTDSVRPIAGARTMVCRALRRH